MDSNPETGRQEGKNERRCPKSGLTDLDEVTHMALAPVGYFETIG
jgi:hypothetical protein